LFSISYFENFQYPYRLSVNTFFNKARKVSDLVSQNKSYFSHASIQPARPLPGNVYLNP
jgi:hypothetical protein